MDILSKKNNDELRNICRQYNLKGFSKCKRKQDLIQFIIDSNILNNDNENEINNDNETNHNETNDNETNDNDETNDNEINNVNENIEEIRQELINIIIGNNTFKMNIDNNLFDDIEKFAKIIFSSDNTAYLILDKNIKNISSFILNKVKVNHYNIIGYIDKSIPRRKKILFDGNFDIPPLLFQEYSKLSEKHKDNFDIEYIPYHNSNLNEYYKIYLKQNNVNSDKLRILYHGTDEKNVQSILKEGFSLATGTKHGKVYGNGIYFTNDLEFSLKYTDEKRLVIVSEIYIENMIEGRNHSGILPSISNSTKRYDTAVDSLTNPRQFIKKDSKDGINILGYFEITFKENYNNPHIRNICRNYNRPHHNINNTNQTSCNRTFKHPCPLCSVHEIKAISKNLFKFYNITEKDKVELNSLLMNKRSDRHTCVCSAFNGIKNKYLQSQTQFRIISLENATNYDLEIYYKPENFNIYTDNISKCKKMTNRLLYPNAKLNVSTKNNDEFIVGYYSNNEYIIIKIIKIDINNNKIKIEL